MLKPVEGEGNFKRCPFNESQFKSSEILDIEDLSRECRRVNACPYMSSRAAVKTRARIIFCPYQYVLDRKIRKSMGIEIEDSLLIFDESHNVPELAREVESIKCTNLQLVNLLKGMEVAKARDEEKREDLGSLQHVKTVYLCNF